MIDNVLSILIGCNPTYQSHNDSKEVKTKFFHDRKKGIFGYITAFFGMIETQARGALHFHVIIWGGISPKLLEKWPAQLMTPVMVPRCKYSFVWKSNEHLIQCMVPNSQEKFTWKIICSKRCKSVLRGRKYLERPKLSGLYRCCTHHQFRH